MRWFHLSSLGPAGRPETDALFASVASEASAVGLDGVDTCGVEAALKGATLASEHGLVSTLATSAAPLGRALVAEQLARAGVRRLEVPVYGSAAAIHDFHTALPGSFRRTLLGVRAARAAGLEVVVSSVLTRSNYRHVVELVRLAAAVGVRELQLVEARALGVSAPSVIAPRALLARQLRLGAEVAHALGLSLELDRAPRAAAHGALAWRGPSSAAPSLETSAPVLPAAERVLEGPIGGGATPLGGAAAVGSVAP